MWCRCCAGLMDWIGSFCIKVPCVSLLCVSQWTRFIAKRFLFQQVNSPKYLENVIKRYLYDNWNGKENPHLKVHALRESQKGSNDNQIMRAPTSENYFSIVTEFPYSCCHGENTAVTEINSKMGSGGNSTTSGGSRCYTSCSFILWFVVINKNFLQKWQSAFSKTVTQYITHPRWAEKGTLAQRAGVPASISNYASIEKPNESTTYHWRRYNDRCFSKVFQENSETMGGPLFPEDKTLCNKVSESQKYTA